MEYVQYLLNFFILPSKNHDVVINDATNVFAKQNVMVCIKKNKKHKYCMNDTC